MPGPTTEVLNEELREIRSGFARMDVALAEVRTEVRIATGITKLFVGVFGTLVASGIASGIWLGSSLSGRVTSLESRLDKIDGRFDRLDARLDRMESRSDARFDRLEASIAKLLAKP